MNSIGTWESKTRRRISTQVRKEHKHVNHRDQKWVGIVGDELDWVRIFGCGLEMGVRDCTWAGVGLK